MIGNKLKIQKGFTLTELLVVLAIIGVISTMVFANYRQGEKQFSLQRSSFAVGQNIRNAQNMAMGAVTVGGSVPTGYGIYFDISNPGQYVVFADEGDGLYGAEDIDIETFQLEAGVNITNLSPASPLSIVFYPPDPSTVILGNPVTTSCSISLNYDGGLGKTVSVNKVGLIEVQ